MRLTVKFVRLSFVFVPGPTSVAAGHAEEGAGGHAESGQAHGDRRPVDESVRSSPEVERRCLLALWAGNTNISWFGSTRA